MTAPATLLGALVDLVADAVVARLRAAGPAPALSVEPGSSTWYTQETSPIARRTYLELCRSGAVESRRVGKSVLVRREVLDAWIVANGVATSSPAATAPPAPAPTNEELLRAAGFSRVAPRTTANPALASGRRRRAGRPVR